MDKQESQLNITEEELQRFQNAMKNEEFRKMFTDYAKEISDPENRKRYEEEIAQLEAERGMDVKFINPQDGFVVKTSIKSEDGMKAFINICQSEAISKATSKEGNKKVDEKNVKGQQWSIPYSLNQPREDLDKAGKKCNVYDVIFHTKTYQMGQEDPRFKQLIINTTLDAIEGNWNVKLDRKNLKYPKLKFKGTKTSTIIRTANNKGVKNTGADIEIGDKKLPYPYKDQKKDLKDKECSDLNDVASARNLTLTPKHTIVHRGHMDLQNFTNARDSRASTRPHELVVNIELPLCETSSGVDLDIFEKQLVLDCSNPNYHLNISLPYPVKDDEGRAQFDKSKRRLIITLPVIPAPPVVLNRHADYEAAESKENGLVTEVVNESVDCDLNRVVSNDNDDGDNHDNIGNLDVQCINDDRGEDDHDSYVGVDGDDKVDQVCEGSKDSENEMNSFQNGLVEASQNHPRGEQQTTTSSGVTCPVFKIPPYSFHQNNESVTFVLRVSKVFLDATSLGFTGNKCYINFPSTSTSPTNFLSSPGYALYIQFPEECLIDSERCSVDINDTNLVLVLYKQDSCHGTWQWFMIGSDEQTLEKKVFLTEETLQESLDQVSDHWLKLSCSKCVLQWEAQFHEKFLNKGNYIFQEKLNTCNLKMDFYVSFNTRPKVQKPVTVSHQIESTSEEQIVIQLDVKPSDPGKMGNILASAEERVFSEAQSTANGDFKIDAKKNFDIQDAKDDTVLVNYDDLEEVEVVEESDEEDNDVNDVDEPQRLTTVQEIDPANEDKSNATTGDAEMQRARAIKCRKNRRRRRRSTGSHESSSFSEEEGDGATRRGKQRGKNARRQRMSRSLSFGSSADSHDDTEHDGHRCVRFNPVPEVRVFSNKADKRKWKEIRKQQLLSGNTDLDNTMYGKATTENPCKLKSSLKERGNKDRESVSSCDDSTENTTHGGDLSNGCEDTDKGIFGDDIVVNDDDNDNGDDDGGDDNEDDNDGVDHSFVKLDMPQFTNPLIFDLDD